MKNQVPKNSKDGVPGLKFQYMLRKKITKPKGQIENNKGQSIQDNHFNLCSFDSLHAQGAPFVICANRS